MTSWSHDGSVVEDGGEFLVRMIRSQGTGAAPLVGQITFKLLIFIVGKFTFENQDLAEVARKIVAGTASILANLEVCQGLV